MAKRSHAEAPGLARSGRLRASRGDGTGAAVAAALVATALAITTTVKRCVPLGRRVPAGAAVGFRAPGFALRFLDDPAQKLSLAQLSGRPAILVFNCGCRLCRDFDRVFTAAAPRLRGAATVGIITSPWAFRGEKGAAFRHRTGFRWPLLVDTGECVATAYHSNECPRVWLIDQRGVIRYRSGSSLDPPGRVVRELADAYRKLGPIRGPACPGRSK